jgi:Domain of unknown function (DUF4145)
VASLRASRLLDPGWRRLCSIPRRLENAKVVDRTNVAGDRQRELPRACPKADVAGNLFEKNNQFVVSGVLAKTRADTLHRIRALGNDAAHEVKKHTTEQLTITHDIIEHLLDEIYILPAKTLAAFKDAPPVA